jgi:checkpoint serine/threonine-protein kinase
MLHVLEKLKKANVIHADIKPENFMVQDMPMLNEAAEDSNELFKGLKPSLILIDFGVSIDMRLLPKDAKFNFKFEKAENLIPEMIENKQWNYQIDYFGIASIAHTILYGGYMKLAKHNGKYEPSGKPKRWWNVKLWNSFFHDFLNIEDCDSMPNLVQTRQMFESFVFEVRYNWLKSSPIFFKQK